jgi:RimJ/RimL family protein N-acetyltransferase
MRLTLTTCELRSWAPDDLESLVRYADNRNIWLNVRDRFPHPYTKRDGRAFLLEASARSSDARLAIAVGGEAVGGIGFAVRPDVERVSAEIGYWLGEPFWGRGIATEAVTTITRRAVESHGLTRMYAVVFAWNTASCRVLEKAGYTLEGRLRRSAIKDGRITDQLQYAYIP